jgi:hypothetical protein
MAFKFNFSKKYNTERLFDIDTSNFEYQDLSDLYNEDEPEKVFPVRGIYINTKGKFDDRPVIATSDCYVNLPAHLCDVCREILNDPKAIRAINEGMVGFTIYTYEQRRYEKTCYSIRWADVNPADEASEDMGG